MAITAETEIAQLRKEIEKHNYNYYVADNPTISDYDYDMMMQRLIRLEEEHPELADENSPTKRVGGAVLKEFEQVTHEIQMQSLGDVFSEKELKEFDGRVRTAVDEEPEYFRYLLNTKTADLCAARPAATEMSERTLRKT